MVGRGLRAHFLPWGLSHFLFHPVWSCESPLAQPKLLENPFPQRMEVEVERTRPVRWVNPSGGWRLCLPSPLHCGPRSALMDAGQPRRLAGNTFPAGNIPAQLWDETNCGTPAHCPSCIRTDGLLLAYGHPQHHVCALAERVCPQRWPEGPRTVLKRGFADPTHQVLGNCL